MAELKPCIECSIHSLCMRWCGSVEEMVMKRLKENAYFGNDCFKGEENNNE